MYIDIYILYQSIINHNYMNYCIDMLQPKRFAAGPASNLGLKAMAGHGLHSLYSCSRTFPQDFLDEKKLFLRHLGALPDKVRLFVTPSTLLKS